MSEIATLQQVARLERVLLLVSVGEDLFVGDPEVRSALRSAVVEHFRGRLNNVISGRGVRIKVDESSRDDNLVLCVRWAPLNRTRIGTQIFDLNEDPRRIPLKVPLLQSGALVPTSSSTPSVVEMSREVQVTGYDLQEDVWLEDFTTAQI